MKRYDIGFDQAYRLTMENIRVLGTETMSLSSAYGRIVAEDIAALVDSPSVEASIKDGYAVISKDIEKAAHDKAVTLELLGRVAAGSQTAYRIESGKTVRVLSGAPIPPGADAVLAEEFASVRDGAVLALADSPPGKNILPQGADVQRGEILAKQGELLSPQLTSLIAAGGVHDISVCRKPEVGLLATGSEVLLPGSPMESGKLFASNVVLQEGWLRRYQFGSRLRLSADESASIGHAVEELAAETDVLITSGGAWKGDRDLIVRVLESLGWRQIFHRVRMGPGKAVGMGLLGGKPVFCLPGGPTSNEMAFLMIALPAVLKMAGYRRSPFLHLTARLEREIRGVADWTQFVECMLVQTGSEVLLRPEKIKSRLASISRTQAIVRIPEGTTAIPAGTIVPYICMKNELFSVDL